MASLNVVWANSETNGYTMMKHSDRYSNQIWARSYKNLADLCLVQNMVYGANYSLGYYYLYMKKAREFALAAAEA